MKRWNRILIIPSCLIIQLSWVGTALAQDGEDQSDILSEALLNILGLFDNLLNYFVAGNVLAEPEGEHMALGLVNVVQGLTDLFAQISTLLITGVGG